MSNLDDCRAAFAAALERAAEMNPNVVVVTNDSIGSSKLGNFRERFPRRLFNVGIAEQNMVGIGSGLANGGKIPFVSGASCFVTGRALEQVKVDLAYSKANVKLCGMSPGLAYGALGATHHSIEDVAWLRAIADMTVIVPADAVETGAAVLALAEFNGPAFLRVNREPVPVVHPENYRFQIGTAFRLRDGDDVTVIANGTMTSRALRAGDLLAGDGVAARVLNMACVKPIDRDAIIEAANETGYIVTVEEHSIHGGLGSAVAEVVVTSKPVPMRILGVPGVFAPTGSSAFLLDHFGLTPRGIRDSVLQLLRG
jgi:transketolase